MALPAMRFLSLCLHLLMLINCTHSKNPFVATSFVARIPVSKWEGKVGKLSGVLSPKNAHVPATVTIQHKQHGMSKTASAVSLTKNIIGAGILALPAGMAAGAGTGQVAATIMALACCCLSTFSFNLIGRSVEATGADDFRQLWSRTLGEESAWVVDFFIFGVCGGSLLVYSCFLGDILKSLLLISRAKAVLVSSSLLVPLVLLPDMSALAPLAYTGLAAVAYTTWFIVKRALETTPVYPFPVAPVLNQLSLTRLSLGSTLLFNMLSTAFMAHTNAVRYYNEQRYPSVGNFKRISAIGFGASTFFFLTVMLAGYRTFGAAAQGLILNNYATMDRLGQVARVATAVSIWASYPLVFTSLRDVSISSLRSLTSHSFQVSTVSWKLLTLTMLSIITATAARTADVGLIVSLSGSLFGASLIYCIPSAVFLKCVQTHSEGIITSKTEVSAVRALFLFGVLSAGLGTAVTCINAFS